MQLKDLEAVNAATLEALRVNPSQVNFRDHPYFGFYEVDIFECPRFLMFTNNDCPRGWDILFARRFEPHSMKLWCRLARQATGILDIGAHVGVYSLAAAALRPDLPIHAFEPNPYAYSRLRMHKLINGFENIVEHPVAVGNANQPVHFGWVKKPTLQIASGAGVGKRVGESVENTVVPMEMLDGSELAATLGDRPLVKIDVEGSEVLAIQGMQEILALKPDIILETFSQTACETINAIFQPLGYKIYKIREEAGVVEPQEMLRPASVASGDLNQLVTTRDAAEIAAALSP